MQQLVAADCGASRSGLALALCQRWDWRSSNGHWKLRSALAILTELEQRGWLTLPPAYVWPVVRPGAPPPPAGAGTVPLLGGPVNQYRPLHWELVTTPAQRREWRELMAQYHYLGAPTLVGASLKYLVAGSHGQRLGALGWHSAVPHLGCRDRLLGWTAAQRAGWLDHVVNGARFLVLPWAHVPHLASVLLSENLRLLQRDWLRHYGAPVWLVESFVDRQRFSGASYRAANWQAIGWTRGFAKRQGRFIEHGQTKEVYVYVIEPRLRQLVQADPQQPLLTRPYLLAQRLRETTHNLPRSNRMKKIKAQDFATVAPQCDLTPADVEHIGQELIAFTAQFADTFRRPETRDLCTLYLQGLLSPTERKNCEGIALSLDGPGRVRGLQRLLKEYKWDDDWLAQKHWEMAAESLSDPLGVWSLDASEMAKKGTASVGVASQYCGALGKTANCQSGVFICYASPHGHALLATRLYLPECWFGAAYAERRKACAIPTTVTFQTKPQLAMALLQPLLAQNRFGGQWITADCSFGNNEELAGQVPPGFLYLLAIPPTRRVWLQYAPHHPHLQTKGSSVAGLLTVPELLPWENHQISAGTKGPLVAAFARVRVYVSADRTPGSERWLLLRNDQDGKIKYALSNAPADTAMAELVRVSGLRWPIERCFEENKSELGLDHYEHRSWQAWHRHMRLVFLAQLFLVRLRLKFKKNSRTNAAPSPAADYLEPAEPGPDNCRRAPGHPTPAMAQ